MRTLVSAVSKGSVSALLVALLLSLPAAWPLFLGEGIINTRAGGDSPFLLFRLHQLEANLEAGVFLARWMPDAAYGLGYPFFNYYAALPFYLAAILKIWGTGYITAIRLTQILGFLGAASTMYFYLRRLNLSTNTAILGSLTYSYAPFHLVNVYVRGDSLSEFYAFVFFPLILWALLELKEKPDLRRLSLWALSYGGLVLTHNISALIFSPIFVVYLLFIFWDERKPNFLWMALLGLVLGLALSAFYWLPALGEREYVQLEEATTGYFHYSGHFRGLDLIQPSLAFNYEVALGQDPFRMGLVQTSATALGIAFLFLGWMRARRVGAHGLGHVIVLGASTFFITPLSQPFWDALPLLPFVQFPWRFLSVQALAASSVIALGVERTSWPRPIAIILGVALIFSALWGLRPEYIAIEEPDITAERLMLYEYFSGNIGSTVRAEYLPQWVETTPFTSPYLVWGNHLLPVATGGDLVEARLLWRKPTSQEWEISIDSPQARLAFPLYWFPGWKAYVDGQPIEASPVEGLGYLGLTLDQGNHRILLRLERTPLRLGSEILSLVTLILVLGIMGSGASIPWRRLGIAVIVMVFLGAMLQLNPTPSVKTEITSDLTMDFVRMPYLHHNPTGVRFGDMVRLLNYQFSEEKVVAGQELAVTLHWGEVEGASLEAEVSLVTLAESLFQAQDRIALSRIPIGGVATVHHLPVPPVAVPGLYLVRVRVYSEGGRVEAVTEGGETLGDTYLMPVRLFNRRPASGDEPVLAHFGDSIRLLKTGVEFPTPQEVELDLEWMTIRPLARNYALSFRFRDQTGAVLFARDLQPRYGFFPTSVWPPGELIADHYLFPLPDSTTPEDIASIELVVYRVADLVPIGTYIWPLSP